MGGGEGVRGLLQKIVHRAMIKAQALNRLVGGGGGGARNCISTQNPSSWYGWGWGRCRARGVSSNSTQETRLSGGELEGGVRGT